MATLPDVPGLAATPPAALRRMLAIAGELGLSADHLAATIAHESGWRPDAVNPYSGATGLIQFMPATARALGTTVEALRQMSALEQLEHVREFFRRVGRRVGDDVAMAVFLPARIGAPAGEVLFTRGQPGYDQNHPLDADKDGTITAGEVRARIEALLARAAGRPRIAVEDVPPSSPPPSSPRPPPRSTFSALWTLIPFFGIALAVRWSR